MADTTWEKIIDKMVDQNTRVYFNVYSNEGAVHLAGDTLVRDHDYFFRLYVYNSGSEVHFRELQARCTTKNIANVEFYSDGSYSTRVSRVTLNWTDIGSGDWAMGNVYFRVSKDIKDAPVTHYGLYAEVVPKGHIWDTLKWDNDKGPQ